METIEEHDFHKPRFRESFMPLEIEDSRHLPLERSVWAWLRTFVKSKNPPSPNPDIYAKLRDKAYFSQSSRTSRSFWVTLCNRLDHQYPVHEPQHPVLVVWYFLILIVLYLQFVEIPLSLFFWDIVFVDEFQTTWSLIFNLASVLLLALDILCRFNVAFYQHGLIVLKREPIVKRYLSWRFEVDLLCLVVLAVYVFADQQKLIYLKLLFFLKLYQTVEYDTLIQNVIQVNLVFLSVYKLLRIIGIFVLYSHIMACGFFYLDFYLYQNDAYYFDNNLLWLTGSDAMPVNMIQTYPWYVWYEYAMYWALQTATTVGYGDITPMNPQEVLYVIINMIFMCVIFGYFINSIWEIIGDWNDKSKKYRDNFSNLNHYLRNKTIPHNLEQKLRAYLDYLWRQNSVEDIEGTIMGKLTPSLRDELTLNIKYPFFLKVRFFNTLESEESRGMFSHFKKALANEIREERYSQDEVVYREGDADCRLFYVLEGKTELRFRNFSHQILMAENFGQHEFLTQQARMASACAIKFSYFHVLSREAFMNHIQLYPDLLQVYHQERDKVLISQNISPTGMACYGCFSQHFVTQCPQLVYLPGQQEPLDPLQIQQRIQFDRTSFQQPIRTQGKYVLTLQPNSPEECVHEFRHFYPHHNFSQLCT